MCIKNQTGGRINILQGFCGFWHHPLFTRVWFSVI
jgi:hypothetical protein